MKTLLIEKHGIYVEDAIGQSVGFKSFADFEHFTDIDIEPPDGIVQVTYEPDRFIHAWFDGINTVTKPIPYPQFDAIIANVGVYKSRQEDPYFKRTIDDAKDYKKGQTDAMLGQYSLQDFEYDGHTYYADYNTIIPAYSIASIKVLEGDTDWSVRWTTVEKDADNVSVKVIHTAQSFKDFAEALFARNEGYFQVAQDHKETISKHTDIEDVKNYNPVSGWEE